MTPACCQKCEELKALMRHAQTFGAKAALKAALDAHVKAMHEDHQIGLWEVRNENPRG